MTFGHYKIETLTISKALVKTTIWSVAIVHRVLQEHIFRNRTEQGIEHVNIFQHTGTAFLFLPP